MKLILLRSQELHEFKEQVNYPFYDEVTLRSYHCEENYPRIQERQDFPSAHLHTTNQVY